MHDKTIAELAAGLRSGDFTSVELTRHYLERIERLDPRLNSFITVSAEGALAAAERADSKLSQSESRSPHRHPHRPQGHLLHRGNPHQLRLADAGQLRRALRRDGGGAPGASRSSGAGQDQHGRIRHGLVQRNQLLRAGEEPLGRAVRFPGVPPADLRRRWPHACAPRQPAPTPAALSASPRLCAASPDSSPPTGGSRVGA